jgi:hypothetical protein
LSPFGLVLRASRINLLQLDTPRAVSNRARSVWLGNIRCKAARGIKAQGGWVQKRQRRTIGPCSGSKRPICGGRRRRRALRIAPWLDGICACFERCSYARNRWCCEAPPASHEAVRAVAGARKCPEGELLGGVRCSRVALCTNDHGCCLCRDASTRTLYSRLRSRHTRYNPLGVALRCVWVVWQWDSGVLLGGAWCLTSVASNNMVRFLL